MRRSIPRTAAAVVLAATLIVGCGGGEGTDGGAGTIRIVGFAVPEAANQAIAAAWNETEAGDGVSFQTSYGASGDQSRAVAAGQPADYVHFSVTSDVTRLVEEGLVDASWDDGENRGVVSTSVVVFAVESGNPLGIEDWDDLLRDDVEIVTPNPGSSGAARWNALAAWGQVIAQGGTEAEAEAYINDLYANAVSLPNSGRDATTQFVNGTGNVFLTYENEAILTRQDHSLGEEVFDYVIPETTLLIENPGAVLSDADPIATQWLEFVLGPEGQREFALKGFRPLGDPSAETVDVEVPGANDPADPYPRIGTLLTIEDDFGSWSDLSEKFFAEETGIVSRAIAASGAAQ